jgi:hypothetical protein
MPETYQLEKQIWSEADFDSMSWHDLHIYACAFLEQDGEFALDVDYILEWIDPQPPDVHYRFWVAPATLVFENVYDLKMDIGPWQLELSLETMTRSDPKSARSAQFIAKNTEWLWRLDAHEGEITFRSVGYRLFVRSAPVLLASQTLEMSARGGISFGREFRS